MRLHLALVLALPTLVACHHSCCLVFSPPQERVWAWGYNDAGQLGYSTPNANQTSAAPTAVPNTSGIVAIAAGEKHSLAITYSRQVVAWGGNADGQLGTGTATASASPIATQMTDAVAVAVGYKHSLAVKRDGTVWAWGKNDWSQLADGIVTSSNLPLQVAGLTDARAVAGGIYHSVALKGDGTVWSWGGNGWGALGDGSTISRSAKPVQATGIADASAVAAGANHTLALRADSTVWAWGSDLTGELGRGAPAGASSRVPVRVVNLTGIAAIAAGGGHNLALRSDGTVWAWGENVSGELGDGTTTTRYAPVQVSGLPAIHSIAAGSSYSLALDRTGRVWAWGSNTTGELGNGVRNSLGSPVAAPVPLLLGVTRLAGGYAHVLTLVGGAPLAQPAVLSFSRVIPGSSKDLPVTIVNIGSENLTLTGLDIIGPQSGDFAVVSGIGAATRVLTPGATQLVTVRFTLRLGVSSAATLRVFSTAVSSPLLVSLSGGGSLRPLPP